MKANIIYVLVCINIIITALTNYVFIHINNKLMNTSQHTYEYTLKKMETEK